MKSLHEFKGLKKGDWIYPGYNNTMNSWIGEILQLKMPWENPQWWLVTKINKEGTPLKVEILHEYASVRAIQVMQNLTRK